MRSFLLIHGITNGVRDHDWDYRWRRAIHKKLGPSVFDRLNWDTYARHCQTNTAIQDLGSDLLEVVNPVIFDALGDKMKRLRFARKPVIIAHSLGSILALRFLHYWSDPFPVSLITIGSPLMRLHYYGLSRITGMGLNKPSCVTSWQNVWSRLDKVTSSIFLGAAFTGRIPAATNQHAWCFHAAENYVRTPAFQKALSQC